MGKFKAVIEVEVKSEKEEYIIEKNRLFQEMQDALYSLCESRDMK